MRDNYRKFGELNNLSGVLNSYIEFDNLGGSSFIACHITPPSGAVVSFEISFDGINFDTFTLRSTDADLFVTQTSSEGNYIGSIIGARKLRFKTISQGSGNGTVIGTFTEVTATLESIEFGYPPHRFGFMPVHKDYSTTSQETAKAIWTPATGKKVVCTDLILIVGGTTDGIISIFNGAGDSEGNRLFRGNINVSNNKNFILTLPLITPYIGEINTAIKVTSSTAMTFDITLHGYEI